MRRLDRGSYDTLWPLKCLLCRRYFGAQACDRRSLGHSAFCEVLLAASMSCFTALYDPESKQQLLTGFRVEWAAMGETQSQGAQYDLIKEYT